MDIKQQKAIEISAKRTELANEVNTEWTPIYLDDDKLNQFDTFEFENQNFGKWFKNNGHTQQQIDDIANGFTKSKAINNEFEKITISPHHWIGLYCELSEFVLTNKIGESIFIQDENGDETINELHQDEYIEIVDEVEDILSNHFIKEGF